MLDRIFAKNWQVTDTDYA